MDKRALSIAAALIVLFESRGIAFERHMGVIDSRPEAVGALLACDDAGTLSFVSTGYQAMAVTASAKGGVIEVEWKTRTGEPLTAPMRIASESSQFSVPLRPASDGSYVFHLKPVECADGIVFSFLLSPTGRSQSADVATPSPAANEAAPPTSRFTLGQPSILWGSVVAAFVLVGAAFFLRGRR